MTENKIRERIRTQMNSSKTDINHIEDRYGNKMKCANYELEKISILVLEIFASLGEFNLCVLIHICSLIYI